MLVFEKRVFIFNFFSAFVFGIVKSALERIFEIILKCISFIITYVAKM